MNDAHVSYAEVIANAERLLQRPVRIREAVRGLIVDGKGRILLVRFEFPSATRWALPGGGLDPGESHLDALRREMSEEIGLHGEECRIGAHVWNRLHIVPFINDAFDGQREQIYEVTPPPGFEPTPMFSWEQLNAEYVFELRWWTADELDAAGVITTPRALTSMLREYLTNGPPAIPTDADP